LRVRTTEQESGFRLDSSLSANPYAVVFHDPELPGQGVGLESWNQSPHHFQHPWLILADQPQNHDAVGARWRIGLNIGEVEVEYNEDTAFRPADLKFLGFVMPRAA